MNSEKNKEKILELLMKLERKEIDQETFSAEYEKLINSEEFANNIKEAKKIDFSEFKKPWFIFFLVFAILLIFYSLAGPYIGLEYAYKDLSNIAEPIQEEYNGSVVVKVNNHDIHLNLIYKYEISGKAVATYHYLPTKTSNKLSPVDIGIAWGYILNDENFDSIKWRETGNRFLNSTIKNRSWYNEIGGIDGLYSNNHLIPSNNKIKRQLKKIKPGDYIQIKGYLINAYWEQNNGEYYWESSTSRYDSGDGACEIIYVTDIKWLRSEK
jgi:hypothetical protein